MSGNYFWDFVVCMIPIIVGCVFGALISYQPKQGDVENG